jgi:hypothetical protein
MAELLVIIVCYVAAALLVHWAARRRSRDPDMRVVVALGRHAQQVEDVVRRLRRWSRWSGKPLRIAVVLEHSDDAAERIVERLARHGADLVWWRGDGMRFFGTPCRETSADGAYWWEWGQPERKGEDHDELAKTDHQDNDRDTGFGTRLPVHMAERFRGSDPGGPGRGGGTSLGD